MINGAKDTGKILIKIVLKVKDETQKIGFNNMPNVLEFLPVNTCKKVHKRQNKTPKK